MRNIHALLLTAIVALSSGKAKADDQCVGSMAELASAPEIQRILAEFGGDQNLTGSWKLSGIAGSFVQARVTFVNKDASFWTQYNDEAPSQINVCVGDDHESLKLVVLQPLDSNNQIVYVKAIQGNANQMMVSAYSSGWKFVKFKKVQSIQPSQDSSQASNQ